MSTLRSSLIGFQPCVWERVKAVYEAYLSRFPENNVKRSSYAAHAAMCGQWREAKKQVDLMGDLIVPTGFGGLNWYYHYSELINKHAGITNPKEIAAVFR